MIGAVAGVYARVVRFRGALPPHDGAQLRKKVGGTAHAGRVPILDELRLHAHQQGLFVLRAVGKPGAERFSPQLPDTLSILDGAGSARDDERAYLDTNVGLGAYIGSLDKEKSPGTLGIHKANYGFTYSVKIGFSYVFNHASGERLM